MSQITIKDVARQAGVSPSTVSRVLNQGPTVAAELRERVLAAVRQLGYRPNSQARFLRTRATTVLGVIISDITNPFFTSMVRGAEDAASKAGYSVVLANTDEDLEKEQRYIEVAAAENMAGVLLSPASATRTSIALLTERGIPVVTIDRRLQTARVDRVGVNNVKAAQDAVLRLVDQGCRRIGFIAGPTEVTTAVDRLAGYRHGLKAAGLPYRPELVVRGDYRIEGGRSAAHELLGLQPRPDALFVSNNLMTLGAVTALREAGLRYPDDIALAVFDDMSWALGLSEEMTLISQPTYEIGRQATELLLRRVAGENFPPRHVVLSATLH
ncbi:LacI family DNA-binding transcriptional regulator [Thermoactinospora rubra]|uniref:LacI family DNA-binding transcriptional regulator n=1 Tax=Thermoactinospora rubra TaxID=1088767 RepID=UPI00118162AE|nr:LacI family DNA-binding transcriptional regulator [Thermoactinospora rubra]